MSFRLAAIVLAVALTLTACGGGGTSVPAAHSSSALVAGKLVLTIANATAANARKPQYISQSAVSVSITVNGGAAQIGDISATSPNCTTSAGGRTCTVPLQAPVGNDTFAIAQYDGPNATGHLLGSGAATATVVAGQAFQIAAVLNGVVATIHLMLGTIPPAGVAGSTTLLVTALDPAGNTIVGPGNFAVPITLSVTDPTQQTTLSSNTLNAPTATPITVIYAGGLGVSATITASASGATPASVNFAPSIGTFYYVANSNVNTLTAYPLTANGNVALRCARWPAVNLSSPQHYDIVRSDGSGNTYVSNLRAARLGLRSAGPTATSRRSARWPARTRILGAPLGHRSAGRSAAATSSRTFYFVATEAVNVFAPGANGNVDADPHALRHQHRPSRVDGITLDAAGNLYAARSFGRNPAILTFPPNATGNIAPSNSISGANTGLNNPLCLILDSLNQLYVCNANDTITVYAAGASGNVAPIRTLGGANTGLSLPTRSASTPSATSTSPTPTTTRSPSIRPMPTGI